MSSKTVDRREEGRSEGSRREGGLRELLGALPLPLAQLLRRALNGKSPAERHNCAFYLAEATLKLAASARIGLYLERSLQPGGEIERALEGLLLPSLGQWCGLLRTVNAALAELPDAALLPLARCTEALSRKRPQWTAVATLSARSVELGIVNSDTAKRARGRGALGFFELLTAYRNEVMGHGSQRGSDFYQELAELLLAAIDEVLTLDELLDGLRLVRAQLQLDSRAEVAAPSWLELTGLGGLPLDDDASGAEAGQLYLMGPGARVPLHPLLVAREDSLGREQVGFLNRTVRRTRKSKQGPVSVIRRVDYLDYSSGETLDIDAKEAVAALLSKLRDAQVDSEPFERAKSGEADCVEDEDEESQSTEVIQSGALLGDFELLGELGRGAMGVVYRARQLSVGRTVALKVLPPSLAESDDVALKRFQREILALARCDHPNVVKVLTSGVDGDRHYYAMELVEGTDLDQTFATLSAWSAGGSTLRETDLAAAASEVDPELPPQTPREEPPVSSRGGRPIHLRLAELFAGAANGLAHLHEEGVVHRDIKPANLMLTSDAQRIVVMDLGLAKLQDESQALTRTEVKVLGTLRYMPPEQLQRRLLQTDHRADIYALGATLYELATGRRFFDGDTEAQLIQQVLNETPLTPRRAQPALGRDLATVIEVATQKQARHRYQSAQDLEADLGAVAERRPIKGRKLGAFYRATLWAQRNRGAVAVALALLLLVVGLGVWHWDRTRAKLSYFAQLLDRGGMPVGGRQRNAPFGHNRSWRFTHRGGKVIKVERISGAGTLVENEHGDASHEFVYTEKGALVMRVSRRRNGQVRRKIRLARRGDTLQYTFLDRHESRASMDGSDVAMMRVHYDAAGLRKRVQFFNDRGSARPNAELAYGFVYEHDSAGRVSKIRVVSHKGTSTTGRYGIAWRSYQYDAAGNKTEEARFGADGKPASDNEGIARIRYRFDALGNKTEETNLGADGKPAGGTDGIATIRYRYDVVGNTVEEARFGTDGKPTGARNGIASFRFSYDERGRELERSFFDVNAASTADKHGVSSQRYTYDARGNRTQTAFFGVDGKAIGGEDGVAIFRYAYDLRGNLTEEASFGVDGKPIGNEDGIARSRFSYDEHDNETERAHFDVAGKPTADSFGVAIGRLAYDERGHVVEEAYFDGSGEPTLNSYGVAIARDKYDERGNRTEVAFFDTAGKPTANKGGLTVVRFKHDERGNEIERAAFGSDGARIAQNPSSGVAIARYSFDERGRKFRVAYFNVKGRAMTHLAHGYASIRYAYDERGNKTEERYYDLTRAPVLHAKRGYASVRYQYDARGQLTRMSFFDTAQKPATHRQRGYSVVVHEHDKFANVTKEAFFGVDGAPVLHLKIGCATVETRFDERGNKKNETCLGLDGKPKNNSRGFARTNIRYDQQGKETGRNHLAADGSPITPKKEDGPDG